MRVASAYARTSGRRSPTPLRLPLGGDGVDAVVAHLDARRTEIATWEKVARDTAFDA
ncbi:hypothetical protein [Streptomyces sp. 142MFCol3.1]|uniref:hypothetical protein n=1 Tax=Streptomyces sp. 142MFCol3.1 TaxID=1172179 RepID=UPI00041744C3